MGAVRIRPAIPDDLAAVARIDAHYVRDTVISFELEPPELSTWRARFAEIRALGLPFLVAELDNGVDGGADGDGPAELVGYAYCVPWKRRAAYRHTVENSIYLAPGARRRGIGGRLLAALLEECRSAGVREVIAVIADSGQPGSVELHRRHGFVPAGRLVGVGFKHGRWLDTVLLQCRLAPSAPPS